ncbi:hypothetical protein, partial [Fodinibius roseus]|uniref:hypothetical protein n=1 Tax=Fodinibius roseus TaxID=1194090 RepID=UPI001B8C8390
GRLPSGREPTSTSGCSRYFREVVCLRAGGLPVSKEARLFFEGSIPSPGIPLIFLSSHLTPCPVALPI